MRALIRQLRPAFSAIVIFTVVCGVVYPMFSTLIGRVAFADKTDGSLIRRNGVVVASAKLGQSFSDPKYFMSRPSAAGDGYDGSASGGSNLGPTNPVLLAAIAQRIAEYRTLNSMAADAIVPVDAVTASASGLDPHISIANARLQAPRVASRRNIDVSMVLATVERSIDGRSLWVLGEPGVNVVRLNLALDASQP